MRPSEKKRMAAMKAADLGLIRKAWIGIGILILVICIPLGFIVFGITARAMMFIAVSVVFAAAFVGIALAFINAVAGKISGGIIFREPVIENRIEPKELFREAQKINAMDVPWAVEVHEGRGWIDVTWRWKDSLDYEASLSGNAVDRNIEVFYKFFKVYDDYTYDDVDMKTTVECRAGTFHLSMGSSMQMGRLRAKAVIFALGTNDKQGTGFHRYALDSDMLANFMHEWFANHGYQYRGF